MVFSTMVPSSVVGVKVCDASRDHILSSWGSFFIIHRDSRLSLQRGTLFSVTDI